MAKKKMTFEEKLDEAIVKDATYEVPENWTWTYMNNIGEYINGKAFKPIDWDTKGLPIIRIQNLTGTNNEFNYFSGEIEEKYKIVNNDLLMAWSATLDAFLWNGNDAVLNQHIFKVRSLINKKYHYYLLKNTIQEMYSKTHGTGMVHITKGKFEKLEVPLPPLKEQQRIVDKIESLFEKLDKAKELIEEARDDFEKRKSAILEKAFRGELTKVWRKENNINREWKREKLKDITKVTSGGTPSRKHPEYFEGKIPWIKTGEILWNKIYDSEEHITEEAIANSSAKLIPEGAVLVAMYGQGLTRGRASILEKEACTNQAVCALIPSDAVLNSYLYYYFMSNYWRFRQVAKGGNQENLSGKVIGAFEIDIPSIEEQNEIVRILDKLLEEESKIEELTTLEEQIELIKKSILAKAFRGQLGTNSEDDESAIELLKEILNK
ncbi:MAG: restriction endonuclease subunit S [Clostridium sp.]|uniref:restriction endonuclease subunit S n=1 Tax=Clostridium sp. TaxID=1506 RepID=UPI001E0B2BEC|nr:restriction endonuclease subunit S [Clostridium sp.]MBS5123909.1 restriction endonuclease subunit S [Clostridium sp.]